MTSPESLSIYWAAACLSSWAGCGVSDAKFADAVNMVCDSAGLTPPQEAMLKRILSKARKE